MYSVSSEGRTLFSLGGYSAGQTKDMLPLSDDSASFVRHKAPPHLVRTKEPQESPDRGGRAILPDIIP